MKTAQGTPPERPSRRQFDREEALDTAMKLFWRHGFESTSMAMLLQALDLTAPSLYAAFGNKERLFHEAVERYIQVQGAKVMAPLEAPVSARAAIEQMLLASAASVSSGRNPAGCLLSFGAINSSDPGSSPVAVLRQARAETARRIRARLERAVADGELPASTDTGRLARFYHAVMSGLQLRSLDGVSRGELEAIARDALKAWPGAAAGKR